MVIMDLVVAKEVSTLAYDYIYVGSIDHIMLKLFIHVWKDHHVEVILSMCGN